MKARPTIYNGIQMRSRLEARYAAWFDRLGVAWEYEPHAFATASRQYLPDFRMRDGMGRAVYFEVRGAMENLADLERVRRQMQTVWASDGDAVLVWADSLEGTFEVATALTGWQEMHPAAFFEMVGVARCEHYQLPGWAT